jgi:methylated-DNA-[protein]-cysteine S-methyltransferase
MTSTTTITEYYDYVDTPFDRLLLVGSRRALTGLYVATHEACPTVDDAWTHDEDGAELRGAREQLDEYFDDRRTEFDMPLEPRGTDFQTAVWREIAAIPYGETVSYGDLADRVGRPGAARAVGAATGRNPISIVIPCHRVVGSDGSLTGYGWGFDRKIWLLEHEGVLD